MTFDGTRLLAQVAALAAERTRFSVRMGIYATNEEAAAAMRERMGMPDPRRSHQAWQEPGGAVHGVRIFWGAPMSLCRRWWNRHNWYRVADDTPITCGACLRTGRVEKAGLVRAAHEAEQALAGTRPHDRRDDDADPR